MLSNYGSIDFFVTATDFPIIFFYLLPLVLGSLMTWSIIRGGEKTPHLMFFLLKLQLSTERFRKLRPKGIFHTAKHTFCFFAKYLIRGCEPFLGSALLAKWLLLQFLMKLGYLFNLSHHENNWTTFNLVRIHLKHYVKTYFSWQCRILICKRQFRKIPFYKLKKVVVLYFHNITGRRHITQITFESNNNLNSWGKTKPWGLRKVSTG